MKPKPKHHAAEREVGKFLRVTRAEARELGLEVPIVDALPRNVADLAVMITETVRICLEPFVDLTNEKVARRARDKYKVEVNLKLDNYGHLLGFLCCADRLAIIFYDTSRGEACSRFTIAHELGHLFQEHVPKLGNPQQADLFGPQELFFAARDTSVELARGIDPGEDALAESLTREYARLRQNKKQLLNEVKANSFAAELLMPFKEVGHVLTGIEQWRDQVERVRTHFEVSRRAAEVRIEELFNDIDLGPTLEFNSRR